MQQHGGINLSSFTPTWSFPTNISDPLVPRPQDFQLGATQTPLMNQAFNPSVPLNMADRHYPWSDFNVPVLSRKDPHLDNLMGLYQQDPYRNAAGSSLDTVPLYGIPGVGEG